MEDPAVVSEAETEMTQPVQEPSWDRSISGLEFRSRQLFRRPASAPSAFLPFNLGELGYSGSGTLDDTYTHTLEFQDVRAGDAIFVASMAPSRASLVSGTHYPQSCTDSLGNTYDDFFSFSFEDAAPAVNTGVGVNYWCCPVSVGAMAAGVDTITVTWTGDVYDRQIFAWVVRHDGGSPGPTYLDQAGALDLAIYADTKVTLAAPAFTPPRDNGLLLANIITARPIGGVSFSAVPGFNGFYQAKFHVFTGSQQTYVFNCQTYGADAYIVANFNIPTPYEIDLGSLPGGVLVPGFNGVGQAFSSSANTWKGITLWLVD